MVLHGYFPLGKTSEPTTKAAGSEVLLLVVLCNIRSFRLASNGYIVCESAYIKVGLYQVMITNLRKLMSNLLFIKYFVTNYVLNFMYIYNIQWKISPKWKYDFTCAINCTCKLTWLCACTCGCDCTCLKEQYVDFSESDLRKRQKKTTFIS